jgi:hypothetical protein
MILAGLSGIMVVEIYSAIMQWKFQNTTNTVGKGFAILGIYLFSVIYCELPLRNNDTMGANETQRWNDQQHNLDLRLRDPSQSTEKQSHGTGGARTLRRHCCQYVALYSNAHQAQR